MNSYPKIYPWQNQWLSAKLNQFVPTGWWKSRWQRRKVWSGLQQAALAKWIEQRYPGEMMTGEDKL